MHWNFDNFLRISSESVNGAQTINRQYDADGFLTAVGALTLVRDPQNGRLTGTSLGNTTDASSYNTFGEISGYQAAHGGATELSIAYTRDGLGRIASKTEIILGTTHDYTYTYDLAGRLSEVSVGGALVSTYGYDSNGNRTSVTTAFGSATAVYDDQDRLLQYGDLSYTYNANGELAEKSDGVDTNVYGYDAFGNLRSVGLPDGTAIEYVVDAKNRRIGKRVNGALVQGFLYEGARPVAELDSTGAVVRRFVYATDVNVPEYMIAGGATYRLVSDHLGSPRLVIAVANGNVVQQIDYDEFGNVLLDTNPSFQPFGYGGGLFDYDTGLLHFGAREYDFISGRWTSKDPIGFAGGETNLYGYAFHDPINFKDPSGLDPRLDRMVNQVMSQNSKRPSNRRRSKNNSETSTRTTERLNSSSGDI